MRVHTGSRKNKHPVEHLHNHQFNKTRLARIRNDFVATSQRTLSTSAHNACLQHLQSARNRSFEWEVTNPFSRQTFFFSFRHTVNFVDGSSLFFICISFSPWTGWMPNITSNVPAIVPLFHYSAQIYAVFSILPNLSQKKIKKKI